MSIIETRGGTRIPLPEFVKPIREREREAGKERAAADGDTDTD
jgi:hypothetical protein